MIYKRLLRHIKTSGALWLLLAAPLLSGCQQDGMLEERGGYNGEPRLDFRATVMEDYPSTRALTQTPVNVEPNEFDGYFYNQINDPTYVREEAGQPEDASKFGYYKVPLGGNGGVLAYAGNPDQKPNWYNLDDDHYFWSWTLPWTEAAAKNGVEVLTWGDDTDSNGIVNRSRSTRDGEGDDTGDGDGDGEGGDTPPEYTPVDPSIYLNTNPIRIKLRDTSALEFTYNKETNDSSWNPGSWGNGYFFEKFIGAKSGPYDFRTNGVEVPLQFRHLMSKIALRSLLFYRANGAKEEDLQANITFINMPTEFTFYPHPTQADVDDNPDNPYIRKDGPPIVVTNQQSADPNGGIMFGFTNPIDQLPEEHADNKVQYRDKFYICPEVDFSTVSFKVEFFDPSSMSRGEYYGDFSSVAFEREPGTDYDNDFNDANGKPVDDTTVLHAGETMYFDLIVKEFGGGGYTIWVRGWTNRPQQQTKHYPHRGIYVEGEATELVGNSQSAQSKFELYGDGFWDGEETPETPELPDHLGMYHLYNDLDLGNRTTFPLDKEYVFDGMGHVLKFSPTSDTTTVTIGKMVDVYIEINGQTVYIDPDGWIYTLNSKTGKYEKTNNQINIHGDKNSFTLNVATGALS